MQLRPPTPSEIAVTMLVQHRDQLEDALLSLQLQQEHLSWYLSEELGIHWNRGYQIWRSMNAKELREHTASVKEERCLL